MFQGINKIYKGYQEDAVGTRIPIKSGHPIKTEHCHLQPIIGMQKYVTWLVGFFQEKQGTEFVASGLT